MSGVRCFRSWCQCAWARSGCLRQYTFQLFFLPLICLARLIHIFPVFCGLRHMQYIYMFLCCLWSWWELGLLLPLLFHPPPFWSFLELSRQKVAETSSSYNLVKSICFVILGFFSWWGFPLLGFDVVYVIFFCMFVDWCQLGFASSILVGFSGISANLVGLCFCLFKLLVLTFVYLYCFSILCGLSKLVLEFYAN